MQPVYHRWGLKSGIEASSRRALQTFVCVSKGCGDVSGGLGNHRLRFDKNKVWEPLPCRFNSSKDMIVITKSMMSNTSYVICLERDR